MAHTVERNRLAKQYHLEAELKKLFEEVPADLIGYRAIWAAFRAALEDRAEIRFHVGATPPWRFYESGKPTD